MSAFVLARALLIALVAVYIISAVVFFLFGERFLRALRARFPAEWERAGSPTFLSLAAWGRGYWRPVSASNYFLFRRYQAWQDPALVRRAGLVRVWQLLMYAS